ncbi:MAG: PorP/SprF family type IX secretion system membrane protein [Flavitalea sp.]
MKKLFIIFLGLYTSSCYAQDPNFSQFFSSPLTLNPAMAGTGEGEGRLSANFRHTWIGSSSPFTTGLVGFDKAIMKNKLQESDKFGIGGYALYDQSNGGALKASSAGLAVAYHKGLDASGANSIGFGFQGTYVNRRLDYTKLTFEDQFTGGGFDPDVTSGDASGNGAKSYFDFNLGVLYRYRAEKFSGYLGGTVNHLMKPKDNIWDELSGRRKFTIHTGAEYKLNQESDIQANVIYQARGKANEVSLGGAYGIKLNSDQNEELELWLGGYMRIKDAFYPYMAVDYKNIRAGLSYDVTVSSMKSASASRKSIEFSFIYAFTKKSGDGKKISF